MKNKLLNILYVFFLGSIIGWIWEVIVMYFQEGVIANRGILHGPWLPIYGTGGVLMLLIHRYISKKPIILFSLSILCCGIMEYITSWALETFFNARWWDYTGKYLNLNGRICIEYLIYFGISGSIFVYLIVPLFEGGINKMNNKLKNIIITVLIIAFIADFMYSMFVPNMGRGISIAI